MFYSCWALDKIWIYATSYSLDIPVQIIALLRNKVTIIFLHGTLLQLFLPLL